MPLHKYPASSFAFTSLIQLRTDNLYPPGFGLNATHMSTSSTCITKSLIIPNILGSHSLASITENLFSWQYTCLVSAALAILSSFNDKFVFISLNKRDSLILRLSLISLSSGWYISSNWLVSLYSP